MTVKDILSKIKYKDTIIRININDDYFEYCKKDCNLLSNNILNMKVNELVPLERRLEIYVALSYEV